MKKMQDKSKNLKASGMRASVAAGLKDSVKRESFKRAGGAGGRPAITVSDVGSK